MIKHESLKDAMSFSEANAEGPCSMLVKGLGVVIYEKHHGVHCYLESTEEMWDSNYGKET